MFNPSLKQNYFFCSVHDNAIDLTQFFKKAKKLWMTLPNTCLLVWKGGQTQIFIRFRSIHVAKKIIVQDNCVCILIGGPEKAAEELYNTRANTMQGLKTRQTAGNMH
jgi:hypothetical protein